MNPHSFSSPEVARGSKLNDVRLPPITTQVPGLGQALQHVKQSTSPPHGSQSRNSNSKRPRSADNEASDSSFRHPAKRVLLSHSPPDNFRFPSIPNTLQPGDRPFVPRVGPSPTSTSPPTEIPLFSTGSIQLPPIRDHSLHSNRSPRQEPATNVSATVSGSKVKDARDGHFDAKTVAGNVNSRTLPSISTIDLPRPDAFGKPTSTEISPATRFGPSPISLSTTPLDQSGSGRESRSSAGTSAATSAGLKDPVYTSNYSSSLKVVPPFGGLTQESRPRQEGWYQQDPVRVTGHEHLTPPTSATPSISPARPHSAAGVLQVSPSGRMRSAQSIGEMISPIPPFSASDRASQYMWESPVAADESSHRKRRGNLPKESTAILNEWFNRHLTHPYPTEDEKQEFQNKTGLSMSQISNWFINARRRRLPKLKEREEVTGKDPSTSPQAEKVP